MTSSQHFHLVEKLLGETPLEAIKRFKDSNPEFSLEDFTYAGRLDPMAEGLLILLSHDEIYKKEYYMSLTKEYEVKILWGVSTDTNDILGLQNLMNTGDTPTIENITLYLKNSIGKFLQKYPSYSSKKIKGKPLFVWAREGKISEISLPEHQVEIFSSKHIKREKISGEELLSSIILKTNKVKGDFRQDEIQRMWKEKLLNLKDFYFTIDTISLNVSSGFYVRQFAFDMSDSFKSSSIAFEIKRIRIGDYTIEDI